jgi:hypothetical protein
MAVPSAPRLSASFIAKVSELEEELFPVRAIYRAIRTRKRTHRARAAG